MTNESALLHDDRQVVTFGGKKLRKGILVGSDGKVLIGSDNKQLYGYGVVVIEKGK